MRIQVFPWLFGQCGCPACALRATAGHGGSQLQAFTPQLNFFQLDVTETFHMSESGPLYECCGNTCSAASAFQSPGQFPDEHCTVKTTLPMQTCGIPKVVAPLQTFTVRLSMRAYANSRGDHNTQHASAGNGHCPALEIESPAPLIEGIGGIKVSSARLHLLRVEETNLLQWGWIDSNSNETQQREGLQFDLEQWCVAPSTTSTTLTTSTDGGQPTPT